MTVLVSMSASTFDLGLTDHLASISACLGLSQVWYIKDDDVYRDYIPLSAIHHYKQRSSIPCTCTKDTSIPSTRELQMDRHIGDAKTELVPEELSQIPMIIQWQALTSPQINWMCCGDGEEESKTADNPNSTQLPRSMAWRNSNIKNTWIDGNFVWGMFLLWKATVSTYTEGWQSKLWRLAGKAHPNIYEAVTLFQSEPADGHRNQPDAGLSGMHYKLYLQTF